MNDRLDVDAMNKESTNDLLVEVNNQLKASVERANILAQKAMAANRARSEFFADMAHEIRTSMNSIIGFSELLVEGNLTGEQKKYICTIQKSAENLLHLAANLGSQIVVIIAMRTIGLFYRHYGCYMTW